MHLLRGFHSLVLLSLSLLLLLHSAHGSSIATVQLGDGSAPLLASLDSLARTVTFTRMPATRADGSSMQDTEVKPMQLISTGSAPAAIASGTVWSAPALVRGSSPSSHESQPLPFIVVASERTLRFYSQRPTASNAASGLEFATQPLVSSSAGSQLEVQVSAPLCACSIDVDSPSNATDIAPAVTRVYIIDSFGRLSSLLVSQSSVAASGAPGGGFAWQVRAGSTGNLAQPPGAGWDDGTKGACPPCSPGGSVLMATSSLSLFDPAPPREDIVYVPAAARTLARRVDLDGDGRRDYVIVRSSVGGTLQHLTSGGTTAQIESQAQGVLGLEVFVYRSVLGSSFLGAPPQESFVQVPQPSLPAATSKHPRGPTQLLRLPSSLAVGFFHSGSGHGGEAQGQGEGKSQKDIVLAVTDYLNGTFSGQGRGVLIQRRLLTLFSVDEGMVFMFDPSSSVSEELDGAGEGSFVPNSQLLPSQSGSTLVSQASAPLLSSGVSLLASEEEDDDGDASSKSLTSSTLRPLVLLRNKVVLAANFEPFPFRVYERGNSPFLPSFASNVTAQTKLQEHQLTPVVVVEHGYGRAQGRLMNFRPSSSGKFVTHIHPVSVSSSTTAALVERVGKIDTSAASFDALSTLSSPDQQLPYLLTGPHASATLLPPTPSPGEEGNFAASTAGDLVLQVREVVLSGASESKAQVMSATQVFHSIPIPPVEFAIDFTFTSAGPHHSGGGSGDNAGQDGATNSGGNGQTDSVFTRSDQLYLKLRHDVQVADYLHGGLGWTEGVRVSGVAKIAVEEDIDQGGGPGVIGSPVIWAVLAVLALISFFVGWIVWRRRHRVCGQGHRRVEDEIRMVIQAGSPVPPVFPTGMQHDLPTSPGAAESHTGELDSGNSGGVQMAGRPLPNLRAPPNSAMMIESDRSPHLEHLALPVHVGQGALLLHPPRSRTASASAPRSSADERARSHPSPAHSPATPPHALSAHMLSPSPIDRHSSSDSLVIVTSAEMEELRDPSLSPFPSQPSVTPELPTERARGHGRELSYTYWPRKSAPAGNRSVQRQPSEQDQEERKHS